MKVYWLDHHPAYNSVEFKETDDYERTYSLFQDGKPHSADWQPIPVLFEDKNKPSDFLRTAGGSLVVNAKTKELLSKHRGNLEFLPLQSEVECYILNVTKIVECVDETNSKPNPRRIGGHLYDHFEEVALDLEKVKDQDLFRIKIEGREGVLNDIFVSEALKEEIEANLSGWQLVEIWDSEWTWQQKEEKFNAMCADIDNSLTDTFEFGKAVKYVQKNKGKQAFSGKWSLKVDDRNEVLLGSLQLDGTYAWMNHFYYPPIILGLKWGIIEAKNIAQARQNRSSSSLEISGLGGWLILIQLGLYGNLLLLILQLENSSIPALGPDVWNELTSKDSSLYDPLWGTLIVFELLSNAVMLIFVVYCLISMYRRTFIFPRLMIIFFCANLGLGIIDYVLISKISIADQVQSPEAMRDLVRAALTCAIWIPYFRKSTRVKNTFVS